MFFAQSRYQNVETYIIRLSGGQNVTVVKLPLRPKPPLAGFHPRTEGQRLDLIASRYLSDACAFWRLCDADGAIVPDALASRNLIAVPVKER
jgi:hypothetical protein